MSKDIYGNTGVTSSPATIKKASTTAPKPAPAKPTTSDLGNDHRGSGVDTLKAVEGQIRNIEYDLDGTLVIKPIPNLKSRTVINLQGLGKNFNGNYFVRMVTHTINRSGYKMEVEVLRSSFSWIATKVVEVKVQKDTGTTNTSGKSTPKPPSKPKPKANPKPAPKPQPAKKPAKPNRYYTVKKGDTLWGIAKKYYGNGAKYTKIYNANKSKIKNPNLIYPGQKFLIPY